MNPRVEHEYLILYLYEYIAHHNVSVHVDACVRHVFLILLM